MKYQSVSIYKHVIVWKDSITEKQASRNELDWKQQELPRQTLLKLLGCQDWKTWARREKHIHTHKHGLPHTHTKKGLPLRSVWGVIVISQAWHPCSGWSSPLSFCESTRMEPLNNTHEEEITSKTPRSGFMPHIREGPLLCSDHILLAYLSGFPFSKYLYRYFVYFTVISFLNLNLLRIYQTVTKL